MVDRIQITKTCWIFCDGQPQVVLSGSVFDVASVVPYASVSLLLSPGEPAGSLASHGKPTPVRTIRTSA